MFLFRITISLFLLLGITSSVVADQSEDLAQEIYYETLSPFCPGRALADCPTEQAREVKTQMLNDLRTGKSKQEVVDSFLQKYGQHLNSMPGFSGLNLFVWLLPALIIIIGIIVVLKKTSLQNKEES